MKHKFILVFSLLIWWVVGTCQTSVETPSLVVTTLTDTVDVNDGLISLREAMQYAQAYPSLKGADSCYTITFDPSIFTEANRMIHWRGQEVINFTSGSGQLRIEGLPNVDITLDGGYDPSVSGSGSAFVQFKGTYNL